MLTSLRSPEGLTEAARIAGRLLLDGQVIALPTDTIYGLAALVQHPSALTKLYDIKGRDPCKPVAICVSSIPAIHLWAKVTVPDSCLDDLLPGPVTVVFERTELLNKDLNPQTRLIGIRIPDSGFILEVANLCGETSPIALTSANLSGDLSARSVEEFQHLWPKLGGVFDAGNPVGKTEASRLGSTVVDLSVPGSFYIIRNGCALNRTKDILTKMGLSESSRKDGERTGHVWLPKTDTG